MADALGIDRSYISDMENGKKNVCLPTMEVLAIGFGISLADGDTDWVFKKQVRTVLLSVLASPSCERKARLW
jgi:transcriptional regulator with XRE-family HTH domain